MTFYYQKSGCEIGPLTVREFLAAVSRRDLAPDTPVRWDGSAAWGTLEGLLQSGALERFQQRRQAAQDAREERLRTLARTDRPLRCLPEEFLAGAARAQLYADFLSREYACDRPAGPCVAQPWRAGECRAVCLWRGRFRRPGEEASAFKRAMLHFAFGPFAAVLTLLEDAPVGDDVMEFETAHDFSLAEARKARRAWRWAAPARWLAIAAGIGAGLAAYAALIYRLLASDAHYPAPWIADYTRHATLGFAAAVFLALASWRLFRLAKSLRLPRALRTLEKHPFRVVRIDWVGPDEG